MALSELWNQATLRQDADICLGLSTLSPLVQNRHIEAEVEPSTPIQIYQKSPRPISRSVLRV